jgi:hypothetical protein
MGLGFAGVFLLTMSLAAANTDVADAARATEPQCRLPAKRRERECGTVGWRKSHTLASITVTRDIRMLMRLERRESGESRWIDAALAGINEWG